MMRSLGAADLLVVLVFVALLLDSRRLHALARSMGRAGRDSVREHTIPAGANADHAGLSLRHIQMRVHVDWQDGGIGWEGPEILPVDEADDTPVDDPAGHPADAGPPETEPSALPVLWKPFPALPPAGATGGWPLAETPAFTHAAAWSGAVVPTGTRP